MKLLKTSALTALVALSILSMTGCAAASNPESSPTPEPSVSAHSVAEPSDYSTASPTPTPTPSEKKKLQLSDEILEISDGIKKVTLDFSGSATVLDLSGPKTHQLPSKLEYKAKQAILDSRLSRVPHLSTSDMRCTADDLAIKISIAKDKSAYRPCEYASNYLEDPIFVAAHEILEEVY